MDLNGPSMFDKDWGTSPQQSTAWAKLTGQPAATLVTRSYPQCLAVGAQTSAERIGTPGGGCAAGRGTIIRGARACHGLLSRLMSLRCSNKIQRMNASHPGLRDDHEVSAPGLDRLAAWLQAPAQIYEARLTGAALVVGAWPCAGRTRRKQRRIRCSGPVPRAARRVARRSALGAQRVAGSG